MPKHRRESFDPRAADRKDAECDPATRDVHERRGILVVDDDHLVRSLVQLGLERNGFDVLMACNGREAIDLYWTHRDSIGVVLLDVRLPDLDGPATLDAMRCLTPELLVCFMNSDADEYEPDELRQRGAAHVIAKPFHLNPLADTLRQLMRGMRADLLDRGEACEVRIRGAPD